MELEFSRQITEFRENPSLGAELFHADGQTDMTKQTVDFLNFANAPKN
jgi:hypothetical protein